MRIWEPQSESVLLQIVTIDEYKGVLTIYWSFGRDKNFSKPENGGTDKIPGKIKGGRDFFINIFNTKMDG